MTSLHDYIALIEAEDALGRLAASQDISPERERELIRQAQADSLSAKWAEIEAETERLKALKAAGKRVPVGRQPRPRGFKSGRLADFHKQVIEQGATMLGADASDFDIDEVKEWVVHHRDLFKKGVVRIYRTIQVKPGWVAALQPGADVGQHWTWDLDPNEFVQFDMKLDDPSRPIVTIEANIATSEVNFPLSVAYNILFPNERELYLDRYAQPSIVAIRPYDFETGKVGTENLRPDLVDQPLAV